MELATALRLSSGDVVAFVGAGGKTSSMRRIIQERAAQMLVIASTTTKLAEEESSLAEHHHIIGSDEDMGHALSGLPDTGSLLFTGPRHTQEPKWTALSPTHLARLVEIAKAKDALVLIEADGARGARLKAPADHEPAIPVEATLIVSVLRIDVIGAPLDGGLIHRPELVGEILNLGPDEPLTLDHLVEIMLHPDGGLKAIPDGAKVRVLVNAVDSEELVEQARLLAAGLLAEKRIASVILASLVGDEAVRETWGRTGIAILAAGGSERFGAQKLLEDWKGAPILRQVVKTVIDSGIQPVVAVLGADAGRLKPTIDELPVRIVLNPGWAEGQSSSLQTGLECLEDQCEAIIFVLGDMPRVDPGLLMELVQAHRMSLASIVAPFAGDRYGNPVLFDRRTFRDLMTIEGDRGGRALFEKYPPLAVPADEGALFDIDRPDDLNPPG